MARNRCSLCLKQRNIFCKIPMTFPTTSLLYFKQHPSPFCLILGRGGSNSTHSIFTWWSRATACCAISAILLGLGMSRVCSLRDFGILVTWEPWNIGYQKQGETSSCKILWGTSNAEWIGWRSRWSCTDCSNAHMCSVRLDCLDPDHLRDQPTCRIRCSVIKIHEQSKLLAKRTPEERVKILQRDDACSMSQVHDVHAYQYKELRLNWGGKNKIKIEACPHLLGFQEQILLTLIWVVIRRAPSLLLEPRGPCMVTCAHFLQSYTYTSFKVVFMVDITFVVTWCR